MVNSYIVYKEHARVHAQRPLAHLAFRRQLIEVLTDPLRSEAVPRPRKGPTQNLERLQPVRHFPTKRNTHRDCVVCSNREEGGVGHLTLYVCKTCSSNPPVSIKMLPSVSHTEAIP